MSMGFQVYAGTKRDGELILETNDRTAAFAFRTGWNAGLAGHPRGGALAARVYRSPDHVTTPVDEARRISRDASHSALSAMHAARPLEAARAAIEPAVTVENASVPNAEGQARTIARQRLADVLEALTGEHPAEAHRLVASAHERLLLVKDGPWPGRALLSGAFWLWRKLEKARKKARRADRRRGR